MARYTREDWPPPHERVRDDVPLTRMASGRDVDVFLPVVCTDRGQHKSTRLTTVIRELDGDRHMPRALEAFAPPMGEEAKPGSLVGRDSYTFICRRCGRTPQVRADRWWTIALRHAESALPWIDVSYLD